jgi:hypothetical protein
MEKLCLKRSRQLQNLLKSLQERQQKSQPTCKLLMSLFNIWSSLKLHFKVATLLIKLLKRRARSIDLDQELVRLD